jgi:hypothetical protein
MNNIALLQTYAPVYFTDHAEKVQPISLELYVLTKAKLANGSVAGVVTHSTDNAAVTLLHYFVFYDHDGGLRILGNVFDSHPYDLEHLVVELTNSTVTGVLYQPHGGSEHFCIRGDKDLGSILIDGKRPRVYASRGKHAQYPVSGTVYRYAGIASDVCQQAVQQTFTVQEVSPAVMQVEYIDGVFKSVAPKVRQAVRSKPVLRLDKVKTHMLVAKFW